MIRFLLYTIACIMPLAEASPRSPYRHVISQREFFIVIDPYNPDQVTAYKVTDNGFEKIWHSTGWYGYPEEIFLANDGMSVVRIQSTPNVLNDKKIEDEPILFFYYKGQLVKEYIIRDLVQDLSSIQKPNLIDRLWMNNAEITEINWHDFDIDKNNGKHQGQVFHSYNHYAFRLITLEKKEIYFNLLDGKRIKKKEIVDTKENKHYSGDPFENISESEQAAPRNR